MSRLERIALLEQGVQEYEQLIAEFEAERTLMLARAAHTESGGAGILAKKLAANQRALELLAQALAKVRARLEQECSADDCEGAP